MKTAATVLALVGAFLLLGLFETQEGGAKYQEIRTWAILAGAAAASGGVVLQLVPKMGAGLLIVAVLALLPTGLPWMVMLLGAFLVAAAALGVMAVTKTAKTA